MCQRKWLLLAALSGLAWVAVGAAMGHDVLHGQALLWFTKAQRYHIVHTVLLCWLASWAVLPAWQSIAALWCFGVLLFSGSLYLMAVYGLPLNYVVPVGGVLMLTGWGCFVWSVWCWRGSDAGQ